METVTKVGIIILDWAWGRFCKIMLQLLLLFICPLLTFPRSSSRSVHTKEEVAMVYPEHWIMHLLTMNQNRQVTRHIQDY